jgi:hypothetical protein
VDLRARITSEHRVSRSASDFRVHDSVKEISLFGHSSISPDACVVDFSDACSGEADERHGSGFRARNLLPTRALVMRARNAER